MTEKIKNPLMKFTIFSLVVNVLCWAGFTFYDWAFNEGHLDNNFIGTLEPIVFFIVVGFPVITYFVLEKRFVSENRKSVSNTIFQLLIWIAICFLISFPVLHLVNNDKWIIKQQSGEFFYFNGLEYFMYAFIYSGVFVIFVPLVKFVRNIVKNTKSKRNN